MRFKEILGLFFLFCCIFKRDASRQIKLPFKLQKQLEMTTNLDAKEKKKKKIVQQTDRNTAGWSCVVRYCTFCWSKRGKQKEHE